MRFGRLRPPHLVGIGAAVALLLVGTLVASGGEDIPDGVRVGGIDVGALPEAIATRATPPVIVVKTQERIGRETFDELAARAESLAAADRQIESLALLDVYGRVARTLLDMAEDVDGVQLIRNKVSRQDMAKVVGASREMVSRVMKDLEERGVIETQENGSVILKERIQTE